jgi:hypothetical protein
MGSVGSLVQSVTRDHVPLRGPRVLMKQNKPDGFMCVSRAWAKPADPRVFEFCENGAKATTWEITHGGYAGVFRQTFGERARRLG